MCDAAALLLFLLGLVVSEQAPPMREAEAIDSQAFGFPMATRRNDYDGPTLRPVLLALLFATSDCAKAICATARRSIVFGDSVECGVDSGKGSICTATVDEKLFPACAVME